MTLNLLCWLADSLYHNTTCACDYACLHMLVKLQCMLSQSGLAAMLTARMRSMDELNPSSDADRSHKGH
jgi:hypothetical protein